MRAIRFDDELRAVPDTPRPDSREGEVRVRVRLAGVCRTDLEIVRGYMGFRGILGHEFVGEVIDGAPGLAPGTRVVGEINVACGSCPTCGAGRPRHCPERTVLGILGRDGAFAEELRLPPANLHPVPDGVSDDEAVFVEPLAAACRILEQVPAIASAPVRVLGDGRLGHLVAHVLRHAGASVEIVGRHPDRLSRLGDAGFGTHPADALPSGRTPFTVDCTGSPSGLRAALALTEPTGTVVLKSTFEGRPDHNLAPVVIDEITVVGSRCGPFPPAIALLADHAIPVTDWIEGRYALDEATAAFAHAKRALKVLIAP